MPDSGSAPDNSQSSATPSAAPGTPAPAIKSDGVTAAFRKRRRWRRLLLALGPIVVVIGAAYVYATGGRYQGTDNAYVQAHMVSISPEISGRVVEVPVHENEPVKQGETLLQIDPEPLQIAIAGAQANLDAARNNITAQKAAYRQRQADLQAAKDNIGFAQREFARREKLFAAKAISESEYDEARNQVNVNQSNAAAIQQDIQRILSELNGNPDIAPDDHPTVRAAQAKLDQARLDLQHATIVAPGDGIVSQIDDIRPGTYLQAGRAAFSLVSDQDLWVDANMKETDMTYVRPGQSATITVDTYPGVAFQAVIDSIGAATGSEFSALPAQNSSGNWVKVVQRIPVRLKIVSQNAQTPLRAGMSVEVSIDTEHHRSLPDIIHSAMAWMGQDKKK
ncbi:MAG TPA: HlyD family secretion protein [Dongiaceae bacterium]|jgi:membrane fusion protein (multidrug efflux system)|nr:HlyD family secretion protein [Dongiaceae bacterium]